MMISRRPRDAGRSVVFAASSSALSIAAVSSTPWKLYQPSACATARRSAGGRVPAQDDRRVRLLHGQRTRLDS